MYKNNKVCPNGTSVTVKVNASQSYNFYVIKDTGTQLTLNMDQNLGGDVSWYNGGSRGKGPLTALEYLESQTNNWTNIEAKNYSLEYDTILTRINVRARMITGEEATELGCASSTKSCVAYLYTNSYSYWTSTPYMYPTAPEQVAVVSYLGALAYTQLANSSGAGIRPVITISK